MQAGSVRTRPYRPVALRSIEMSLIYELLYRVGFLLWDTDAVPDALRAFAEGPAAPAPRRALDVGCGTGMHAVYLAARGWDVTAIDNVGRALRRARDRAAASNVTVNWVNGDVSRLDQLELRPGFGLGVRPWLLSRPGRESARCLRCRSHRSDGTRRDVSALGDGPEPPAARAVGRRRHRDSRSLQSLGAVTS
jgi:SAM-dependent methyltransferase